MNEIFSAYSEKSVSLDIVTVHFSIIESKNTDRASVKLKKRWVFSVESLMRTKDCYSMKMWTNLKRNAELAILATATQTDDNYYSSGYLFMLLIKMSLYYKIMIGVSTTLQ